MKVSEAAAAADVQKMLLESRLATKMATRTLKLSSPRLKGGDVSLWQKTLNSQLERWGIKPQVTVDGEYGDNTKKWSASVLFGLGIAQREMDHGITPTLRRKVRDRDLTKDERKRYNARAGYRHKLKARLDDPKAGPKEAIAYARAAVGTVEHPAGSNRGPHIDDWEKAVGMIGQSWCGAFVAACYRAAGLHPGNNIRYTPALVADAKAGRDIWEGWHTKNPQPGDAVLYDFPGGDFVDHVGLVVGDGITIEGNTSSGTAGNQSNGGGVFVRDRKGANVIGYARPDWKKAA